MFKHLFNNVIIVFAILAALVFFNATSQAAPVLSMALSGQSATNDDFYHAVVPLETFTIDIYFDLPTTEYPSGEVKGLFGVNFNLGFDSDYFQVEGTSYNGTAFEDSSFTKITVKSNYISFGLLDNLGDGPDDQFLMGSVTFSAKDKLGTTLLIISDPNPSIGYDFMTQTGGSLDPIVSFKTGEISVVPIPGALWLLGSGLIGMVGVRRKLGKS
ncbi:MAG: VPLPA-CTERM sorting domain-containing protein [Caldisericaceae bacterium]|nr:VPLPA-CTERM sorting domain-containing protein [Caldisericaceae bacterium]